MSVRILIGDAQERLAELPDESVHCVVTSPPYFGLRDYGIEPVIWGGADGCAHEWGGALPPKPGRGNKPGDLSTSSLTNPERQDTVPRAADSGAFCRACQAWRGSLGLEPTPWLYIEHMVEVFREVRRVLRKDGTIWLNIGDSYASGGGTGTQAKRGQRFDRRHTQEWLGTTRAWPESRLRPKDLMMMPARVALALQADGWYLRSDIIWAKPNPMPESVTDRPTSAHEHVFLLSKSKRYFYDADAVKERNQPDTVARYERGRSDNHKWSDGGPGNQTIAKSFDHMKIGRKGNAKGFRGGSYINGEPGPRTEVGNVPNETSSRNLRNVWHIATHPYPEAHFATFPPALVEPCIKAGCPTGGIALDPFGGAGTVGLVAARLQRSAILIELNPEYAAMAERRIHDDAPLLSAPQSCASAP